MSAYDPKRTCTRNSAELFCSSQTADHGDADQIVVGPPWIGDNIAQTRAELFGILQILLVLNRLLLHVLLGDGAPLHPVAVELFLRFAAMADIREAASEVESVVDTAVHAHAAKRIIDVGCIANEKHAILA